MLLPAIRQARLTGAFGCASDAIGRGRCLLALQNIQSEGELTTISTICAAVARGLLVQAFWESPLQGIYYYSQYAGPAKKRQGASVRKQAMSAGLCMGLPWCSSL